jgi:hypothetical protein
MRIGSSGDRQRRPGALHRGGERRAPGHDRTLIAGPRHLRAILDEYVAHYNRHRPHRGENLRPPDGGDNITAPVSDLAAARIRHCPVLGGLIREYERAA